MNTTEAMLREFYSAFGRVVDVVVMVDSATGRSRCFGFVTFAEPEHADRAIAAKPHVVDNRTIDAKRAIPREVCFNPLCVLFNFCTRQLFRAESGHGWGKVAEANSVLHTFSMES